MQKIIIIAGATASGKSSHAVDIASKMESPVIINIDSMQIYKGLEIITAQPSLEEKNGVEHLLYGYQNITQNSSMGDYFERAIILIKQQLSKGKQPIIVGGTAMYIKALMRGFAYIPEISEAVQNEVQAMFISLGNEAFYAELKHEDAAICERFTAQDTQRITRAMQVLRQTGRSILYWQSIHVEPFFSPEMLDFRFVTRDREDLYARVNSRFENMASSGAIDEVEAALKAGLTANHNAYKAIGVREIASYLAGEMMLYECIATAQQNSRRYVKRQLTFFRNQFENAV